MAVVSILVRQEIEVTAESSVSAGQSSPPVVGGYVFDDLYEKEVEGDDLPYDITS